MNFPFCQAVRVVVLLLLWPALTTQAAHPLITEDTNNNTFNDRTKLWHASVAVVRQWGDQLKVVLDTGLATNTDCRSDTPILFVTAGGIWSPRPNLDFDFGLRTERTDTLRALTALVGATIRR